MINKYTQIAANHAGAKVTLLNHLGGGIPLANVTKYQVQEYWVVVKQQYNAKKREWITFPKYETAIKTALQATPGEILFEDEYGIVFYGKRPQFSLHRKVEVVRCLVL